MADSDSAATTAGLDAWLVARGFRPESLRPLPGDVSPRRYARVRGENPPTAILAVYPESVGASCDRFRRTTLLLAAAGVPVPSILAADVEAGWMLVEDLGQETLYECRDRGWSALLPLFLAAARLLPRFAALPAEEVVALNPALDAPALARELHQTWELFLAPRRLIGGPGLAAALADALALLCARLGADPPLPCHRDFMARNLMPLAREPGVAVLDHQDLRLGPPAYDLASLLNDSLFPPGEIEEQVLVTALPAGSDRIAYHRAAAQRTLKAIGTFAAFAARGVDRHLPLIPPTLRRAREHLARLPEAAALAPKLAALWEPVESGGSARLSS